jgi:uncharacterized damage-inducible protein DinB
MDKNAVYTTIERFLDHWDGVRLVTLKLLICFHNKDLNYRLTPHWRTVGEIFHHIGGHQFFVARGVLKKRWEPQLNEPDIDWDSHKIQTTKSVKNLQIWLLNVQALLKKWFKEADKTVLSEIRDDNPWHEGMRGWLLLHHPYQDELHHRGQLYAIARLLGKDPPNVFAEEYPSYWHLRKGH